MNKSKKVYRNTLLAFLGVTWFLQKLDYELPTKWFSVFEGLKASSSILHDKASEFDEDVSREFIEKEEMIKRRLGNEKFYDEEEVEQLRDKIGDIQI